jgi:glycosyltransferase involved in cell wall biosynthesis
VIAGAFRLSPEKRPLLWIEAAAEVLKRQPSAQFLLFGDGPMRSRVELVAHRRGIADRVRICGITNDIRFAFAAADVVMLTSLQEGTPNVLIEAQAMGIPVITTPAFGAAEAVEDHGTGRVINTGSAAKIAAAVLDVVTNPGLRARMSSRGPRWIDEQFGAERMVDELLVLAAIGADRLHTQQTHHEVEPAE